MLYNLLHLHFVISTLENKRFFSLKFLHFLMTIKQVCYFQLISIHFFLFSTNKIH